MKKVRTVRDTVNSWPGLSHIHKAVTCQIKVQWGIHFNLVMTGVPLIPFSNTKRQINDLRPLLGLFVSFVLFSILMLSSAAKNTTASVSGITKLALLRYTTLWWFSRINKWTVMFFQDLRTLQQKQKGGAHTGCGQGHCSIKLINNGVTHMPIFWHLTGCRSEILFFSSRTYNMFGVCKFFTWATPLVFFVNIKTNGNPHHHPWSIGKRLLSSWLPVRSATDQGGSKVTHTL